ncbi:5-hydroxytryptamine receptor 3E-like [Hyperolius riggenbachi]|uniref:5-hydroxytryptamine receptor 3E-like n=1 Tax=Hyperolius riggenbachi TaxID=752182 RepID=UPI0035A353B7
MSLYRVLLLITATVLGVCHCENCSYWSLVQALNLSSQASDERPVQNWLTPTEVTINLKLYAVVELDTSAQTLIAYSWFSMEWKNEFISWNSEEHCAIEGFFAAANNIWKPDIYILEMTETNDKHPVILYYYITQDGTITAAFPLRTVSSCNVDIFMYPYDTQSCTLSFTPYAESGNTVDLSPRYDSKHVLDASNNISSKRGEWNLLNMMVVKEDDKVIYTIILKRNPSIQVMAFIVPTCLLIILDVVGMFIHFEKDDRIMFKITIILGFSLLLVVLNTILPTSDCPPLLSIFCVLCMAIMVASIIGSIMTSYLSNLSDRNTDMPHWMKFCIKTCLAHALFMKRNVYKADGKATSPAAIEHVTSVAICFMDLNQFYMLLYCLMKRDC